MNDFTKDGKPRSWKGMQQRIGELENELALVRDGYNKEIERLKLVVKAKEETIKKQAAEIRKVTGYVSSIEAECDVYAEKIKALMGRTLWERIINEEV